MMFHTPLPVAEFEEGGRVYTRLSKGIEEDEIKVGMELKLVSIKLPNGKLSHELMKPE